MEIKNHVEVLTPLPAGDSKAARKALKCTFCDRPAVTIVKGYPVCRIHAEMLEKGEITPPTSPPPLGAEPRIKQKS